MWELAQAYGAPASSSGASPAVLIIYAVIGIALIIANWKIFEKAGEKGWKAIIPIYNTIILLRIVGMSAWYVLILFIPLVNLVFLIIIFNKLAKAFGYGVGMTILCFVVIGEFILGFGSAKYKGPEGPIIADTPYPKKPAAPAA